MGTVQGNNDLDPKQFALPVDKEHKSKVFPIFSVANPHMRAFHLSWVQFFACFVSSFAAPPLLPIIRDNLNLTATDIGNAGIASVSGAVFARIAMGTACDLVGPRLASASLTLLTAPAVYLTSSADSATWFLLVRFFTGFSLATFVSTQFWMSSMFSPPVVGRANGVSCNWQKLTQSLGVISGMTGGGGNVGAVITQLIFFKGSRYTTELGISYMGIMMIACSIPITLIYFPQWGGMLCGPKSEVTEVDYYMKEWDSQEQQQDLHQVSLKFADSSKSERGKKVESASSEDKDSTPTHV
ncbi:high affinity nitrate transporter 2.5-like [Silene latifolia]|uniref:high affinity nitrate transporter 2.5-like n=1 Tax=Silene latifolia TaxID=37657 RepID=UPI003D76C163